MSTWIIILLAILGIVFIAKLSHLKHKISISFAILFLLFIYLSFVKVLNSNELDVNSAGEFFSATKLYFSWLGHAFSNIKVLTGNAIRMDWFTNSTG